MKKIEPLEKRKKRYPIGLSHSELIGIVWIDPKTEKKRIFRTKSIDLGNPARIQRDLKLPE